MMFPFFLPNTFIIVLSSCFKGHLCFGKTDNSTLDYANNGSDDNVDGGVTVIIVLGVLTIIAAVLLVFLYKIRHSLPALKSCCKNRSDDIASHNSVSASNDNFESAMGDQTNDQINEAFEDRILKNTVEEFETSSTSDPACHLSENYGNYAYGPRNNISALHDFLTNDETNEFETSSTSDPACHLSENYGNYAYGTRNNISALHDFLTNDETNVKVPTTIAMKKNKTIKSEHEPTDKRNNCHKDTDTDLNENDDFIEDDIEENEIRIVLLGKTGTGKSATANTILGIKGAFETSLAGSSVTERCVEKHTTRFKHKIVVIDTPGVFDTRTSNENTQKEIFKCMALSSPGPHAFVLVISISRHTEEEKYSLQHFVDSFGEEIYKYFIILFTSKDQLEFENKDIYDYIRTCPDDFQMFLKECGGRVVAFNNRLDGKKQIPQVKELLQTIFKNISRNEYKCYTNAMYKTAEASIQKKEQELRNKLKKMEEQKNNEMRAAIANEFRPILDNQAKQNEQWKMQAKNAEKEKQATTKEIIDLKAMLKKSEKEMNESKENQRIKYVKQCEELENRLKEIDEGKKKIEAEQKRYEEMFQKGQETIEKLKKEQREAEIKSEENNKKKYEKRREHVRDDIRDEIEREEGFFAIMLQIFKKVFNFVFQNISE